MEERTAELTRTVARLEQEMQARREQEAQLVQARKLEAIGRLTGGIAHDFNNLLMVIKGNLYLLGEQAQDRLDAEERLFIEDAQSATQQSIELTSGLLAFSRQQPLRAQLTSVNRLVQDMERLLSRVLGPAITWQIQTAPDIPDILIDPGQLQTALLNLVLNARDAMPRGGALGIHTALVDVRNGTDAPTADLTPGRYVEVTVTDTGIGMDAATLARACEPFFTTKKAGQGTGLGLSTVYGFATQSQGSLVIQSQPGLGTCVRLFLPVVVASDAPKPATALDGDAVGDAATILVVEDQAHIRRLASRYLRNLGYAVLEAANGQEAIEILETEPDINLVFTDIVMPNAMSGYDLAAWVAAHRPGLPCLLTTGYSSASASAIAHSDLPPFPVLAKPYSQDQLAHEIRQLLDPASKP